MDFPSLVSELTPLVEAAGLQNLSLQHDYCGRYGHFYSATACRGTASVVLLLNAQADTQPELQQLLADTLLDQLAAYYATAAQL